MKFLKIPILLILLLLPASVFSQIQNLSPDSAHYEVKIGQFYGGPGDTVMMPIYIRNQNDINTELFNGTISGMLLRIVYDSLASDMEDLLIPIVKYADPISTVPPSFIYYLQVLTTGRGDGLIYVNHTNYVPDTSTLICYNQNKQDSLTNYLVILYSPPFNINTSIGEEFPVIPASGTDATVCLYVPMRVNPNAQIGCTTRLYFKDYDFEEEYINQFSSGTSDTSIVTQLIRPYLNNKLNIFTVSDNDPPVIDPISPNSISIQAGQSIAAVTVSATDPNGDNLCLTAYDLPTGATFGTSGEVCGTGSASGTLNWTTTTAISGTFTVNFMAEDAEGATSINSTVTIVVNPYNPSNQPPTIATISPNTFTVQQGEAIPPVTVTATDPEGASVTLQAIGAPPTATFTPSNPVTGTGSTNMTVNWTTSFTDAGVYTISFRATDAANNQSATQSIIITVEEIDEDRLYTTSTWGLGTRPTGGIPGATPVVFPIDLVTSRTVYGINFEMGYPGDIALLDSIGVTDRTPEYLVYENINAWPDSVRVMTFGLDNEVIEAGTSSAILNAYFTIDTAAPVGDYRVRFYEAWESIDPDPEVASLQLAIDSGIIQVDRMGDVNLDGHINVDDPVKIVSYIIGTFGLPTRNYNVANVIDDGDVNVIDLVGVINMFFGDPVESSPSPISPGAPKATLALSYDDLYSGQYTKLNVQGEFPEDVAGIQLQIDYDPDVIDFERPEISEVLSKYRLDYKDNNNGRINVLISSFQSQQSGEFLGAGAADIVYLPANIKQYISSGDNSKIKISKAYLSTPQANSIPIKGIDPDPIIPTSFKLDQNYPNPFNPSTVIEYTLKDNGIYDVTLEIFNILGQKVKTLVDESQSGGNSYQETWYGENQEGKKVATGMYFYRLHVNENSETKKMLLLK